MQHTQLLSVAMQTLLLACVEKSAWIPCYLSLQKGSKVAVVFKYFSIHIFKFCGSKETSKIFGQALMVLRDLTFTKPGKRKVG